MPIRILLILLGLALSPSPTLAQPLMLVTKDEMAREEAYAAHAPEPLKLPRRTRALGDPWIEVNSPQIGKQALTSPLAIEVAFKTMGDAQIVPQSFQVLYGFLGIDITERILRHVRPTEGGLSVGQAEIPKGNHTLRMQIKDSKGRRGETTLAFTIE
ncbi:MAG: hypothetical protein M0P39_04175 [Rhodocyclaceae bacterium]|jgi:hypothetical protein|nr:hypothetical protein [Rhodocyclaceae bacterium]